MVPSFQGRGLQFDPWLGSWDPTCHGAAEPVPSSEDPAQPKKKKKVEVQIICKCFNYCSLT